MVGCFMEEGDQSHCILVRESLYSKLNVSLSTTPKTVPIGHFPHLSSSLEHQQERLQLPLDRYIREYELTYMTSTVQ